MFGNVNMVLLLGRLGEDGVLKSTKTGASYMYLSLATTDYFTNVNGQQDFKTDWHSLVVYGAFAEAIAPKCLKGTMVYCEGKLEHYQSKTDTTVVYKTNVKVNKIDFIPTKSLSSV
jgi:single-strand DNA-binding protein